MFIVALHSLESFDWSMRPFAYDVARALLAGSSALFFFISGYLFQHLSGRFDYRRYLLRKVETVVTPYLVVSIPALIVSLTIVKQTGMWPWFYDLPIVAQVSLFLITGKHLEPLWFVPTMILFYLAAPMLLRMDRSPRWYWLIAPTFIISLVIGPNGPTGPLHKAAHYLSIYMIGMCVSHYREIVDGATRRFIGPLIAASLALFFTMLWAGELAAELQLPFKLCNAFLVIFLLRRWSFPGANIVDALATASFAIYFLHGYLLGGFRLIWGRLIEGTTGGSAIFPASISGFALHTVAVLVLCLLIVRATKLVLPLYSRRLIGA